VSEPRASASVLPPDEALAAASRFGTIREVEPALGLEGLHSLFHGDDFTAMVASPTRAEAEERGAKFPHPLAPRWVGRIGPAWAIERVEGAPSDPVEALVSTYRGTTKRIEQPLGEILAQPDVAPARALIRCGIPKRRVDRALARLTAIELEVGPTLGGASTAWIRVTAKDPRPVSLVMRRAQEGWPVLDLAALAVKGQSDASRFFVEHPQGKDRAARQTAHAAAMLRVALREAVLGRSEDALAMVLATFAPFDTREPERVSIELDAPPFLDRGRYLPLQGEVPASHARFVMRMLDGVVLGGQTMAVRTTPAIRPGRVVRAFEPLSERLTRVLGDPDARFDDEGLYSATPVTLAREVVQGLSGVVIDGTCGLGCLAIAAAELPAVKKVIAIELDEARLALARNLIALRGQTAKIELRRGDIHALLPTLKADALILDPPWGGRDYDKGAITLKDLPLDVRPLITSFRGAIRLKIPRGLDVASLPSDLTARAMIDEQGAIKFLLASRG
jgi:trimethylguanosine synthase